MSGSSYCDPAAAPSVVGWLASGPVRSRVRIAAFLTIALTTLSLSACSGRREMSATSPTTTTSTTTTAAGGCAGPAGSGCGQLPPCAPFRGVTTKLASVGPDVGRRSSSTRRRASRDASTRSPSPSTPAPGPNPPGYVVQYRDAGEAPVPRRRPAHRDRPAGHGVPRGHHQAGVEHQPGASRATRRRTPGTSRSTTATTTISRSCASSPTDDATPVSWVIGLDGQRPFVVDRATDPMRITVYIG